MALINGFGAQLVGFLSKQIFTKPDTVILSMLVSFPITCFLNFDGCFFETFVECGLANLNAHCCGSAQIPVLESFFLFLVFLF